MPYRAILAVVSGRVGDIGVLEAAHVIARHFQSHVDVLFVNEDPRSLPYLNAGVAPGFVGSLVATAESKVRSSREKAHSIFTHWVQSAGLCMRDREQLGPPSALLTASWIEKAGNGEQIGRQGRFADLIVMEQPVGSHETNDGVLFNKGVESALMATGRPILFVPTAVTRLPPPETWVAMIAWNGSAEATRAVSNAVPLLVAAKVVKIFCGTESEKPSRCTSDDLRQFRRYLSLQVISADFQPSSVSSADAGRQILEEATKVDAELLVMGAFTHSRMREFILGGATKYVLTHAHIPVLMTH